MHPDELVRLWQSYVNVRNDPDAPEATDLRNQLVLQYQPLVRYIAWRAVARVPSFIEKTDLMSYGTFGLINAVERFDPTLGIRFETFAEARIGGAILDGLRREDGLSRTLRRHVRSVRQLQHTFIEQNGRTPTWPELEQLLPDDIGPDAARTAMVYHRMTEPTALSAEVPEDSATTTHVEMTDEGLLYGEIAQMVARRIAGLPARHRAFMYLHYFEGMTLKDVGFTVGVSDSRAGQVRLETIQEITA